MAGVIPNAPWTSPVAAGADATPADWIAAWGQVAGALFGAAAAGVALWVAFGDRAERRIAQARLVSIRSYRSGDRRVIVHNRSGAAVIDVELLREDGTAHDPGASPGERDDTRPWWEIAAGESRDVVLPDGVAPVVRFTDAAGVRWRRGAGADPVRERPSRARRRAHS